ncbi:MAG: phosphotransferase [Actinomycetota bacterium]
MEADPETDTQAIAAAVASAVAEIGLRVDEPAVLRAGANLVLHLRPHPVVARVATLTAEMRRNPADYLRRERDIATALHQSGVGVITPTDLVDPGPHHADGHWFLLMTHRRLEPVDLASDAEASAVGRSLADLEAALDELPVELGAGDVGQPWDEIATLMATVEATTGPTATGRLVDAVEALKATEPDDRLRLVHGDARRVNVARSRGHLVWFDFEDANSRPVAWDLATLRRSWPAAGDEACRRLHIDPSAFSMAWHHELREVYALLWNLLYAERDPRVRTATGERLAAWLTRTELDELIARTDR